MRMVTIINPTVQLFHMPRREIGEGETFGGRLMLQPGGRITVPDAYVESLLRTCKTERGRPKLGANGKPIPTGWALRLEDAGKGTFRVKGAKGAMGVFEARILAAREKALEAQEAARVAGESAAEATAARIAAEKRANDLETRVAQLEALLTSATDPKPPKDSKPPK